MTVMYNTQTKYWYLTSYETEEPPYLDSMTYPIAGRETCPDTGNKHRQCYTELKTKQRMSFSKNHDYHDYYKGLRLFILSCCKIKKNKERRTGFDLIPPYKQNTPCCVLRPLSRVPFR